MCQHICIGITLIGMSDVMIDMMPIDNFIQLLADQGIALFS